jgi:hypothetical protein
MPLYVNIGVPWWTECKPDDWRLGVMRTPPEDWMAFKNRNEVGSYRRHFDLPASRGPRPFRRRAAGSLLDEFGQVFRRQVQFLRIKGDPVL